MSRSHAKNAWSGDPNNKYMKRLANRKVRQFFRRNKDIKLSRGDHKKVFESWNISDYKYLMNWEQFWREKMERYYWLILRFPNRHFEAPDRKEAYREWRRYYYNK